MNGVGMQGSSCLKVVFAYWLAPFAVASRSNDAFTRFARSRNEAIERSAGKIVGQCASPVRQCLDCDWRLFARLAKDRFIEVLQSL